jgi:hypothetical protein
MRTEFKDIANHFIGSQVLVTKGVFEGRIYTLSGELCDSICKGSSFAKPILYPLSAITDEQKKKVYELIFQRPFPETGAIIFKDDKTKSSDPRFVLMTGLDRLGIELNGTVWADCDLNNVKFNQHLITKQLCSWHYNVFGLEPDQFIDPATLPTDPYKQ